MGGAIGVPPYLFVVAVLGAVILFGGVAFALLSAAGLPSAQRQPPDAVRGPPTTQINQPSASASRIVVAVILGVVWFFVWMLVFQILDALYRNTIPFNPADPYPLIRISFMISIFALAAVVLLARLAIWIRGRRT
jgi:hypothetical protein